MIEHIRYPKITEDTGRWSPDHKTAKWLQRATWYVTEKVHGAHFSVICDGQRLAYAKRGDVLAAGEEFFWHRRAVASLEDAFLALSQGLFADIDWGDGLVAVHIHGELYGGAYPHPEVVPCEGVQAIQTGVYYCPDIRFCVYDIGLHRGDGQAVTFLSFGEVLALCEAHGLETAPVLAEATWAEASGWSPVFQSVVAQSLGLPPLQKNWAEGVVIRAQDEVMVQTDGGDWVRPILKIKHPKFAEDARYHQAKAPQRRPPGEVHALTLLEWEARTRLNSNRVAAARSKVGAVSDVKALAAEVAADIWQELLQQHPKLLDAVSQEERALLRDVLWDDARAACLEALGGQC